MKSKIIQRAALGALIGIAISHLITVWISLQVADGRFYPVSFLLIQEMGSEINAIVAQTVCEIIYGAVFAGASIIWEVEHWSLLRMTLTHLLVCSLGTFPCAYFSYWMPHSVNGILAYFGIFLLIYFIIWSISYLISKKQVRQLNQKLDTL